MRVYCPQCGTAIDASAASVRCPSCTTVFNAPELPRATATRTPPQPPGPHASGAKAPSFGGGDPRPSPGWTSASGAQAPVSVLAVVSLVSGLLCCVPCAGPLTALATGAMALKETEPNLKRGRGLAVAGLVLGSLGMMMQLLSFVSQLLRP